MNQPKIILKPFCNLAKHYLLFDPLMLQMSKETKNPVLVLDDTGFIYLTKSGKSIAEMIYERHELLSNWLKDLGVPSEIASNDACKMEHVISKDSFEAIKKLVQKNIGRLS